MSPDDTYWVCNISPGQELISWRQSREAGKMAKVYAKLQKRETELEEKKLQEMAFSIPLPLATGFYKGC